MKKFVIPIVVSVIIIVAGGLGVAGSAPREEATSALFRPANTPPAPGDGSLVYQLPPSLAAGIDEAGRAQPDLPAVEDVAVEGDALAGRAQVPSHDVRFPLAGLSASGVGDASPQATADVYCVELTQNPQMDVEEFGDGTGSVDYWVQVCPEVYFDNTVYASPLHSLVMVDENDGYCMTTGGYDYDALGQAFLFPNNLLTVTITYNRLYQDANGNDDAYGNLYTLTEEGALDTYLVWWPIGESPVGWSSRYTVITDTATLDQMSGEYMALVFELYGDTAGSTEVIWLDDAQVTACYEFTATDWAYLPILRQDPVPRCVPKEPDSRDDPGSTVVGVTCGGSFSPLDTRDYYSLDPGGVSNVRLWLRNMPSGTNWGAAIFEDAPGNPYVCHIGTTGSSDKYVNCTLNPSKQYFVKVDAGTPPGSTQTYQMSVVPR
ncbi:MAG: hypothetical protein JW918_02525 [Anaerolineae bacterium]|nr:hypothetical protein [Anaerolineae bacterium]